MANSEVEAVLEFLRKNGFSEAESALKVDMIEKNELGSFDFEKFLFPMMPPPPPVRIPASSRRSEADDGGADCERVKFSSGSSSDDEFVSLESSTSGVCSSEFVNPYGLRSSSQTHSDTSSDRLSQFGTAREYHDFDMQNDLYVYEEKDEDYFMTPCFGESGLFGCPSEDKFVMTSETKKELENPLCLYNNLEGLQPDDNADYLDKPCVFNISPVNLNEVKVTDYYHFDRYNPPEEGFVGKLNICMAYDCSDPFCKFGEPMNYSYLSSKETDLSNFQLKVIGDISKDFDSVPEPGMKTNHSFEVFTGTSDLNVKQEDFTLNGFENYVYGDDLHGDSVKPKAVSDEVGDVTDELSMYNTNEDEYEVFDLRIIHRKNRTGFEENKDLPIVLNAVIAGRYCVTEYLGSAAFSKVVQAHDLHMGMDVCLKIIKNDKDFFDQSLDEIKLLKLVNKHDPTDKHHILRLYDYFYHHEHLFIVCELLRANLYEFQKFNQESGGEPYFTLGRLQVITRQCLEALEYLHHLGIIHCDLKPENILIKSYKRCEIKVIDLGSSCFQTDNLCLYVQSRSYRAPEVILGLPYDQRIDLWSLGCILAELCSGEVLFPNDATAMILARMIGLLGPIDAEMLVNGQDTLKFFTKEYDLYYINEETDQLEYIIPEESSLEHHLQISDIQFLNFLRKLLEINPQRRPTAKEALKHPWLSRKY